MRRKDNGYVQDSQEEHIAVRDRLELMAGMSNFFSVVLGSVVILLLVLLIASLLNWLRGDIAATFTNLNARF